MSRRLSVTAGCKLPGETRETIDRTIALSKRLPLDLALFHIAAPHPGTPFYHEVMERGWFRGVWQSWADMPPATRVIMAVLCVYCTVIAQKPTNVNNSAASPHTGQPAGGAVAQQQQAQPASSSTQPPLPATQGGPSGVQSEPSRIVLQATLAADPRVAAAFSGEPGWSLPAAVPAGCVPTTMTERLKP